LLDGYDSGDDTCLSSAQPPSGCTCSPWEDLSSIHGKFHDGTPTGACCMNPKGDPVGSLGWCYCEEGNWQACEQAPTSASPTTASTADPTADPTAAPTAAPTIPACEPHTGLTGVLGGVGSDPGVAADGVVRYPGLKLGDGTTASETWYLPYQHRVLSASLRSITTADGSAWECNLARCDNPPGERLSELE